MSNLAKLLKVFFCCLLVSSMGYEAQAANPKIASCQAAPKTAATIIPKEIDRFAKVYCSDWGAFITAPSGLRWKLYDAQSPVVLPSDELGDKTLPGWSAFFTKIEVNPASSTEAIDIAQYLAELFHFDKAPDRVYHLVASSNKGLNHDVYLAIFGDKVAGVACAKCPRTLPFSIVKD